jgi:hypothetical protein
MNVRQSSDRSARSTERDRRAKRWGFAAGVLASIALGLACASGGSRTEPVEDAPPTTEEAAATVEESGTVATTPPSAVPDTPPAEAPAPGAPAQAAPAAATPSGAAPGAGGDSPVAAYLADPKAMGRATQLFRAVCTGYCHSTEPTADRVAPNLFDCEWTHGSSDEEIFQVVSAGIPDTQMQGFGEKLPKEDLWKLVAFMRQKSTCK